MRSGEKMGVQEKLSLIRQLAECLSGLSVMEVENTSEGIMKFINYHFDNLLLENKRPETFIRLFKHMKTGNVYEVISRNRAHFLVLLPNPEDNFYVIGPCLTEKFTEESLYSILKNAGYLVSLKDVIVHYYEKLPVLPENKLRQLGEIIGQEVFEKDYQGYQKTEEVYDSKTTDFKMDNDFESIYSIRKLQTRYEMSAAFLDAVAEGKCSLAFQFYTPLFEDISHSKRNKNELRNAQNYCVIMNSQLRQAVSKNGINPFLLDQISGGFAVRIENMTQYEKLVALATEMIETYCCLVKNQKNEGKSLLIKNTITLIADNLASAISVKEIAARLNVNADYLSNQFSKEIGCTLTEYINRERVHAAGLLRDTMLPVWNIAGYVGYNNVSYFSKQFQKYFKMTPSEYRNRL